MLKRAVFLLCCLGLPFFQAEAQQANGTTAVSTQKVDNTVKVSYVDDHIKVENVPANSRLEIYNIVGSKVKEIMMTQPSGEYHVTLPKGYYIVRIDGGIVRKIVVR